MTNVLSDLNSVLNFNTENHFKSLWKKLDEGIHNQTRKKKIILPSVEMVFECKLFSNHFNIHNNPIYLPETVLYY